MPNPLRLNATDARWLAAIAALALLVWAPGLGSGSIVNGDDGLYAVVIRAIARGADPAAALGWRMPVFYVTSAASVRVFGETELALHLPSLVYGVATATSTYLLARALWPETPHVGGWAALILVATTQMFMFSRRVRGLDLCFTTWMTLGMIVAAVAEDRVRRWAAVGVLVGLGFLTKSVVIATFAPAYAWIWWTRVPAWRARLRAAGAVAGTASATVACWLVPLLLGGGRAALQDHFGSHVVDRATGAPLVGQVEPPSYYIDALFSMEGPLFALAACLGVAAALLRALRRGPGTELAWVAVLWACTTFGLFSAAASKVQHYILPAYPALALCVALGFDAAFGRRGTLRGRTALVIGFASATFAWSPVGLVRSWGDADYAPSMKAGAVAARARLPAGGRLLVFNEYHTAAMYYFDGPTLLLTTDPAFAAQYDATHGFRRDVTHILRAPSEVRSVFAEGTPTCLIASADRMLPGMTSYLGAAAEVVPFEGGTMFCGQPIR